MNRSENCRTAPAQQLQQDYYKEQQQLLLTSSTRTTRVHQFHAPPYSNALSFTDFFMPIKVHVYLLCVAVVLLSLLYKPCHANPDAKRLYDDLLSNYNRLIRPVSNNTDTILVKLGLRLSQLIDLVWLSFYFLFLLSYNM